MYEENNRLFGYAECNGINGPRPIPPCEKPPFECPYQSGCPCERPCPKQPPAPKRPGLSCLAAALLLCLTKE